MVTFLFDKLNTEVLFFKNKNTISVINFCNNFSHKHYNKYYTFKKDYNLVKKSQNFEHLG